MNWDKLGDIASSKKARKSSKDDSATALCTQDSDYLIERAGWDSTVATDIPEMRSEGGIQLENMLNQRMGATLLEDNCVALGPKLMEYNSAKHVPNLSHGFMINSTGSIQRNSGRVDYMRPCD